MLNAIVSWALNMRVLVVAAAAALLSVGINATRHAPLDVFPEFAPPLVEVQTEAPGLSTEEVDALARWAVDNRIDFVVIGPESAVEAGLADALREVGIAVLGPGVAGGRLESSKRYAKELLARELVTGREAWLKPWL